MPLIDRRGFLKLFSAAFAMRALGSQAFCAPSISKFESASLGLRFSVPRAWHAMDGISALKIIDPQVFIRDDPDDISATPLMVYSRDDMRHEDPSPRMNPNVTVYVDAWCDWMGDRLPVFADACYENYASMVIEPEQEVRPEGIELSGHHWERSVLSFLLVGASGFEHRVRMQTYATFIRGYLVVVNQTGSASGHDTAANEFADFESSVATSS